jgi:predicted transcriptional regulator of viral defense system
MQALAGISKENRAKLSLLIRGGRGMLTVSDAAKILEVVPKRASVILSQFANNGWLSRIKRGVYIVLPLEAQSNNAVIEDSWVIASKLFSPCYIGGWSALEHWGLTEQIFYTNLVCTSKKFRDLSPEIKGAKFLLRVVYQKHFFGLKSVWRSNEKVQVSDASRTMVDILNEPKLGGGIRAVADALENYFKSDYRNSKLLIEYADTFGNKAVFKRLGFLAEYLKIDDTDLMIACKNRLSTGNAQLDHALGSDYLITRWRLWVPKNWKQTT